jgi:hypothetical protein
MWSFVRLKNLLTCYCHSRTSGNSFYELFSCVADRIKSPLLEACLGHIQKEVTYGLSARSWPIRLTSVSSFIHMKAGPKLQIVQTVERLFTDCFGGSSSVPAQ